MALSGPKIGIIDHKKFQGFQKWDKISKKTFKSDTSPKPVKNLCVKRDDISRNILALCIFSQIVGNAFFR